MPRTVIAGIDGSAESRAAALWAAREAALRGLPLSVLHVWQPWTHTAAFASAGAVVAPRATGSDESWAERLLRETEEEVRARHPRLDLSLERVPGHPVEVLGAAADEAEVLVLGSRALGTVTGFLTGSVSISALARARRPVVLVRPEGTGDGAPAMATSGVGQHGDVVLGLDLTDPCDPLVEYAVNAAGVREAALRVVHTWAPPPVFGYDPAAVDPQHIVALGHREQDALEEALQPWRAKYPQVRIEPRCVADRPAARLVEAAEDAALLVVGRRIRSHGGLVRIGPVTHAVLHHARTPIAVVPHA
ncbi:universal stress protein [Streptomyces melanogenes]|uniref:universal stress protein n=1 Tax=Streptomyces melanogenes TaxID=67326 RepID=UPI00167EA6E0|nr:universal stress protein [Streptomyces melanogenes]GGP94175.1 stress-inducible protein [Streptomyces melanogenes]